jgi:hypothetical protein
MSPIKHTLRENEIMDYTIHLDKDGKKSQVELAIEVKKITKRKAVFEVSVIEAILR